MTSPLCACGQPVNGAVICRACEQALAEALDAVGWLAPALDEALARQVTFAERAGRGSGRPLPFDERAAEAKAVLRNELVTCVRMLAERGGGAA